MPETGVYFVSPRRIASIAAALTLSGVSMSGSPAPRPMMSRPAAFSSRAFWLTAMVADGLMRDRAVARKAMAAELLEGPVRRRSLIEFFGRRKAPRSRERPAAPRLPQLFSLSPEPRRA